jgi:hypothetical protein
MLERMDLTERAPQPSGVSNCTGSMRRTDDHVMDKIPLRMCKVRCHISYGRARLEKADDEACFEPYGSLVEVLGFANRKRNIAAPGLFLAWSSQGQVSGGLIDRHKQGTERPLFLWLADLYCTHGGRPWEL